ncbi:hypothetical protein QUF84_18905 [Fictibacillus enclensis]|uniref:Uncharacterized protein n=2 Tax=Fictibacillus enclensis TaxID=1017270 RepID=A0A0V8J9A7_9BACL|nr:MULTISPECIES: hypothetical protein [Fictibacillus]KSU83762.1 hypothetical protein AS030_14590 [Fictibacillus enclensis]MDM5339273.1 hypothetical protein [Fictibacillus enclensis]RXY98276.1 hypothetical protein DMO16_00485 [Fictibacillus sp. S7]
MPRRYFKRNRRPPFQFQVPDWLRAARDVVSQFTIPLIVFQIIRTILFPSGIDFMIILILVILHFCFSYEVL